jgi:antitoxin FitA
VTIQIRNVPDALHRRLKSRAALAGMSLSDYLLGELRQVAERPTLDELRARLHSRLETAPSVPPAEVVRSERDRTGPLLTDASALLEALRRTPPAKAVEVRLFARRQTLHAPHLLDVDVAQVIRHCTENGEIIASAAARRSSIWRTFR